MNTMKPDISLSKKAPQEEPLRQYYYIEKAKQYVEEEAKNLGRSLTFCVTTFGCQMNARDSEKLRGILNQIGYEEAEEDEADFVIYNTCKCKYKSLWTSGTVKTTQKTAAPYDDRTLRLYDAGTGSNCKIKKELFFRRHYFRNT